MEFCVFLKKIIRFGGAVKWHQKKVRERSKKNALRKETQKKEIFKWMRGGAFFFYFKRD